MPWLVARVLALAKEGAANGARAQRHHEPHSWSRARATTASAAVVQPAHEGESQRVLARSRRGARASTGGRAMTIHRNESHPLDHVDRGLGEGHDDAPGVSIMGPDRDRLIEALQRCATAAEHCASAATGLPDVASSVHACRDTATLCQVAAQFLARGSAFDAWLVPAAAMSADACATECGIYMDAFFQDCARACRALTEAAEASRRSDGSQDDAAPSRAHD